MVPENVMIFGMILKVISNLLIFIGIEKWHLTEL
jgi:hypothetical protein